MPKKTNGIIDYSVITECPECGAYCDLTDEFYADQHGEDPLGNCVFGGVTYPAKWDDINLPYKCKHCHKSFVVDRLIY